MDDYSTLHAGDLILVGGGHTHSLLLRQLGMAPIPALRVTLISDVSHAAYSGMLHGMISNRYTFHECHIDLQRLCIFAGAAFIRGRLESINLKSQRVQLEARPAMGFDMLSLNTGSTPTIDDVPGATEHAIPAKPVGQLLQAWHSVVREAEQRRAPINLTIVGGGPGGVELALAMHARLGNRARIRLVQREKALLPNHPRRAGRRLTKLMLDRGIELHTGRSVEHVDAESVTLRGGGHIASHHTFWVTHAAPPPWIATSNLPQDKAGFIRVHDTLQTVNHDRVFAVGDVAAIEGAPRSKSGVHAVRQAPTLAANLRDLWLGQPLRPHRPQKQCLSLVSTSNGSALASRGRWTAMSPLIGRAKESIDRRFMRRFSELTVAARPRHDSEIGGLMKQLAVASPNPRCRGCGAKLPPGILHDILSPLSARVPGTPRAPEIDIGLKQFEDGAALQLHEDTLLIQSVDHLPALIDDLYLFGRIAVLHGFSDIFAMGAQPHSGLVTVVVPVAESMLMDRSFDQMMQGISEGLAEVGATLVAGHTLEGKVAAVGLTANGTVTRQNLLRKGGMRQGDAIILTKPLGIGTLFAAAMQGKAQGQWLDAATDTMLRSNATAAGILHQHGATACTDVTGFGLAGHLLEMVEASTINVSVNMADVPLLDGALDGQPSSLYLGNATVQSRILFREPLFAPGQICKPGSTDHRDRFALLFDPQTSGGLLATVAAEGAEACVAALRAAGDMEATCIGHVKNGWNARTPIEVL